ncbi:MAG: hypothetical protein HY721_35725 [Planctomycetes bacterium]|nr:hypothetical protein [Planctomycetota bacterium]
MTRLTLRRFTLPCLWIAASLTAAAEEATEAQKALDEALKDLPQAPGPAPPTESPGAPGDLASRQLGPANLRLIDVSLDALFAAGSSTERDEELQRLQGGGHDPRKRGFTVQNVELSLQGAVDPFVAGEAHLIYFVEALDGESVFELEEAFLTTLALPWGLQLEAGQSFTELGRVNPQHPHQWDWQDQPVVNARFFGPDGMRGPGLRLGWLTPLPWYSEVHAGVQNANGETMASFLSSDEAFEERPIGGRPFAERDPRSLGDLVYLLRWEHGFDVTDALSSKAGLSGLHGPNATGADGLTRVYGADLVVKWRPVASDHGWPFVVLQGEALRREYFADDAIDEGDDPSDPSDDVPFSSAWFRDWGLYAQALWGFRRSWAAGFRYEVAGGEGPSGDARRADPFRDDRQRVSPLLVWHPTHFSRLRLQYNLDLARRLPGDAAHSVWLGAEILFGAHPVHSY